MNTTSYKPLLLIIILLLVIAISMGLYMIFASPKTTLEPLPKGGEEESPVGATTGNRAESQNTIPKITQVLPSASVYQQGEGAGIPVQWTYVNIPNTAVVSLSLLSPDGNEAVGAITNTENCEQGGDGQDLKLSDGIYRWDGLYTCLNWQLHPVKPGKYKIGVYVRLPGSIENLDYGASKEMFEII